MVKRYKEDRHWIKHTVYRALRDSDPDTGSEHADWPESTNGQRILDAEIGTRKCRVTERVNSDGILFWREAEKTPRKIQPRTYAEVEQFWKYILEYYKKRPVSETEIRDFYGKTSIHHAQKRLNLLEEQFFPRRLKPVRPKVEWVESEDWDKYA